MTRSIKNTSCLRYLLKPFFSFTIQFSIPFKVISSKNFLSNDFLFRLFVSKNFWTTQNGGLTISFLKKRKPHKITNIYHYFIISPYPVQRFFC